MIRLIHIAPELPPAVGGVSDYTAILSRRLVELSGGAVKPVLIHAGNKQADKIEVEFPVIDLSGYCSASALAEAIGEHARVADGPTTVLLEYAGYGYASSGAPLWLLRGVRQGCTAREVRLITVFHELYGRSLRPWTRTFWTMPVQYYIATRLARLSDGLTANWARVTQWLSRRVDGKSVYLSPSFSNVGEPEALPTFGERESYAVCFGGAAKKEELYAKYTPSLIRTVRKYGLERVIDIGPEVSDETVASLPFTVEKKGVIPAQEVSRYLQNGSLGLLNYGLHCLRKSGVWGSYAAHGLPTIVTTQRSPVETLREGEHFFLPCTDPLPNQRRLGVMSRAVRQWYDEMAHSRRAAQRLVELFENTI